LTADYHVPVLVREACEFLITDPDGIYVDATLGGGGHAMAVLSRLGSEGRLIGIDRDADAIRTMNGRIHEGERRLHLVHGAFGDMETWVAGLGFHRVHGVLFDLGVSSRQIDDPGRGFSYLTDGPLDLRMDTRSGLRASDIVNGFSEKALADLFYRYGEERRSRAIAAAVVEARAEGSIETTGRLAEAVRRRAPGRWQVKTLARVFQALRIEVNDELGQLAKGLAAAARLLAPGGRLVAITYHSLEDRLVKRFFRPAAPDTRRTPIQTRAEETGFQMLTKKVVRPSREEIKANPRARSAKLRASEKREAFPSP
jgi:16S rRNA (cytosine1402-N4)-methyltransferase